MQTNMYIMIYPSVSYYYIDRENLLGDFNGVLLFNIRVNTARDVASKFQRFYLYDSSSRGC